MSQKHSEEKKPCLNDALLFSFPITATLEDFKGKEKRKGKITGNKLTQNKLIAAKYLKGDGFHVQHNSHIILVHSFHY